MPTFNCPIPSCNRFYRSVQGLHSHVNEHLSRQERIPQTFYTEYNRVLCHHCWKQHSAIRRHTCINRSTLTQNLAMTQASQVLNDQSSQPEQPETDDRTDSLVSISNNFSTLLASDFDHFRKGSVLYRIPKASRIQVCSALNSLIVEVCVSNSIEAWRNLLRFPSQCLFKPDSRAQPRTSLSSTINRRIAAYMSEPSEALPCDHHVPFLKVTNTDTRTKRAKLVQRKIEKGDIKGAVRVITSDEELSQFNEQTLSKLQSKHPTPHVDREIPSSPTQREINEALQCDETQIRRAIRSFAPGSASGPDLLEPQHLKDLTSTPCGETGNSLIKSLTRLINLMLRGNVPDDVVPFLYGASLTALNKVNSDVRPIAVGTAYRRIASKIASRHGISMVKDSFYPHQYGVGIRKGSELIVHNVRNYLSRKIEANTPFVMLKVDFANAFNTVRRDVVLNEIRNEINELFPFVNQMYSANSNLFYGEHKLISAEGMQQGDPIGPLGFSLAINKLVHSLKSELNFWYLDDGCLIGEIKQIHEDLNTIIRHQDNHGLRLNISKCELFDPMNLHVHVGDGNTPNLFLQMKLLTTNCATLLGAPLFHPSAEATFMEKVDAMVNLTDRIRDLDSHYGFYILKNCLSMPKLLYLLRTYPFYDLPHLLMKFDDLQRTSLESILNCAITPASYVQAFLPTSYGGLGFRRATDLALPSFIASANGVSDITNRLTPGHDWEDPHLTTAKRMWQSKSPLSEPPTGESSGSQRAWDRPLVKGQFELLLSAMTDDKSKCRLLSASAPGAGVWLNSTPIQSLGLKLNDEQLRIAIALRLGADICIPHKCKCGAMVDKSGTHGLSCRQNSGRAARHHEANDILRRALVSAGVPAVLEPLGLSRDDGKRPDGITLIPWTRGLPLIWDYTCVDTLAASNIRMSVQGGGTLASNAEEKKRRKYESLTRAHIFCPFAMETLGAWGDDAKNLVSIIGGKICERNGETRSTTFLKQRLSLAVQRGNAASIISCMPTSKGLHEVDYL